MKSSNIGGQAVIEGIMMRSGDRYALAVRKPDGQIEVREEPYKSVIDCPPLRKIPIIRGVIAFIDSLVIGIRCTMASASFFEEEEDGAGEEKAAQLSAEEREKLEKKKEKEERAFMTGTLLFSVVIAVAVFMLLPYFITSLLGRVITEKWVISLVESLIRVGIFLGYLVLISRMKEIRRTFMYHGAEHKCINCVEHGLPLTVENVLKSSRQHKRCGTSFLFFVIIVSAVLLMFVHADSHLTRILIRLLLIPAVAGISYEIIRLAGRTDNPVIAALSMPGLALQRLTTREPDADQAEVAIAAVEAVFDWRTFLSENYGDLEQT